MSETQALYRMYDFMDKLLYVGRTVNPISRLRDHRIGKDWWDDVQTITIERFDSAEELSEAELVAIRTEHPIHNVIGGSIRMRIAETSREIDKVYGTSPGTSLKAVYDIYWPPEQCSAREFEIVHLMAERNLRVAIKVKAGMSVHDAWELIDMSRVRA
jgi:hypothetical protein